MWNGKDNYLKMIIGPMFSSKSSSLLHEINLSKNKNVLVINSILDKDRHSENCIITHDNNKFPAIMLRNLQEIKDDSLLYKKYLKSDIIVIDEGQFFKDLYFFIRDELNRLHVSPKMFIIAGLNADCKMEPIGDIIKLIPLADSIIKLFAVCSYCKSQASFTKLIKGNITQQITVGGSETYTPTCRTHFI